MAGGRHALEGSVAAYVYHNDDPNVTRPGTFGAVVWIGSVEPNNMANGDFWEAHFGPGSENLSDYVRTDGIRPFVEPIAGVDPTEPEHLVTQSFMKDYVSTHNVENYGAVGDGSTDNTQALQNAADAAEGSIMLVPAGTFLTDPISLSSNTTVVLIGTLKLRAQDLDQLPSEFGVLEMRGTDVDWLENIHIIGMGGVIDGDKANMTGGDGFGQEGIEIEYARNCSVSRITVVNTVADGIDLDNCENIRIVENTVSGAGGWGIHCSHGAFENLIAFNDIENCGFDNNRGGIDQWGNTPGGQYNRFIGNVARNNYRNYGIARWGAVFLGNHSFGTTVDDVLSGVAQGQPYGELAFGSNSSQVTLTEAAQTIVTISDVEVHGPGDRVIELHGRGHIHRSSGDITFFRGSYLIDDVIHDRWVSTDETITTTEGVGIPKRVILSPGVYEFKIDAWVGDETGTKRLRGDVQATELRITDLGPA